jgi:hypothetical protein
MHSSSYLYLTTSNSFETPPNPSIDHSSTPPSLWSKITVACTLSPCPLCLEVASGGTHEYISNLATCLKPAAAIPSQAGHHPCPPLTLPTTLATQPEHLPMPHKPNRPNHTTPHPSRKYKASAHTNLSLASHFAPITPPHSPRAPEATPWPVAEEME